EACQSAVPARYIEARVAGKGLREPAEQALGERIAVGLQLVDVALWKRRDVARAQGLILCSRRQRRRERQQQDQDRKLGGECAHLPTAFLPPPDRADPAPSRRPGLLPESYRTMRQFLCHDKALR